MIYVFLANGFEEVEALAPVDMLRRAKQEVTTVGVTGKIVTGSHHIPVTADITAEELQIGGDMDMIVLPGGMPGTLNEEASPVVQAVIDYCVANDRWIGAICAAPSILGHKGVLNGKTATCYTGFEKELTGAEIGKDTAVQPVAGERIPATAPAWQSPPAAALRKIPQAGWQDCLSFPA